MSDNSGFRIPLEIPLSDEYDREYMVRLLNQLRLNFNTITNTSETNEPVEAFQGFFIIMANTYKNVITSLRQQTQFLYIQYLQQLLLLKNY
ncbi:MAG: hypothetical protein CM15mV96_350 [uncultured marine virus]|nr:MAG: hypothetical protein CM15mV96_350 [uncultured marine virus]